MAHKRTPRSEKLFFIKLLIPYLVILLPLTVIGFSIIRYDFQKAYDARVESVNAKLGDSGHMIEMRFDEIRALTYTLSHNEALHRAIAAGHAYDTYAAQYGLKVYPETNRLINMLGIHYMGGDIIYTNIGYSKTETYVSDYVSPSAGEGFSRALAGSQPQFIANGSGGLLHYIDPMRRNGAVVGHVIYQINKKTLDDIFMLMQPGSPSTVFVVNEDARILFRKDYGRPTLNLSDDTLLTMNIDSASRGGLICLERRIAPLGLRVLMVSEKARFLADTNTWSKRMSPLLLAMALGVIAYAFWMAIRQYRSLHKLLDQVDHEKISNIEELATAVIQEHESIHSQLLFQQPLVRQQIIIKLLNGSHPADDAVRSFIRQMRLDQFAAYSAFHIVAEGRSASPAGGEAPSLPDRVSFSGGEGYICALPHKDTYAALLCYRQPSADSLNGAVDQLKSILDRAGCAPYSVGAGSVCPSLEGVGYSYAEAVISSEYRFLYHDSAVIQYDMLKLEENTPVIYALDDVVNLSLCLRRGDQLAARQALDSLIGAIERSALTPAVARSMVSEISSHVIRTVCDMKMYMPQYSELYLFDSIMDAKERLYAVIEEVCGKVRNRVSSRDDELYQEAIDLIKDNIGNYELSMGYIASQMKISISYLGRILKKKTGQTFLEYTTRLRIEKAEGLLRDTDLPVSEIAEKVGYSDTSSFIRVFKRLVSLTPGAYRDNM